MDADEVGGDVGDSLSLGAAREMVAPPEAGAPFLGGERPQATFP